MTDMNRNNAVEYPRQSGGRFAPGNPGKPMGAKHRANAASWRALDELKAPAFAVLRQKLDEGDAKVAMFIVARFLPSDRLIELNSAEPSAWADAMAAGEVTPSEAAKAAQALSTIASVEEVKDLRERLDELEAAIAGAKR